MSIASAALGLALLASAAPPSKPTGLLLVTVDTLRADHLGCYGYGRPTSPRIDRLAAEGVVFESAYAPRGVTGPSLTTLMTSQPPLRHGVRQNGVLGDGRAGGFFKTTIATELGRRGWVTAVFTPFPLVPTLGFQTKVLGSALPGQHIDLHDALDEDAVRGALAWLDGRKAEPFFLWVHLISPHAPYEPSAENARRLGAPDPAAGEGSFKTLQDIVHGRLERDAAGRSRIVALYDAEIRGADARVGRLLDGLAARGLAGRTLVVLAADHGEELFQRQNFFSHEQSLYDAVLRVPLVLRGAGLAPRRVGGVVELGDVAPTLLDLLGLPAPADFGGRSLRTLAEGRGGPVRAFAVSELYYPQRGVAFSARDARFRYLFNPDAISPPRSWRDLHGELRIGRAELYDHRTDPLELTDVSARFPDEAARLRRELKAWRAAQGPARAAPLAPAADVLQALIRMGYVTEDAPP